MSGSSNATHVGPTKPPVPIQAYARAAGVLLLISVVAGFFGEVYVPGRLIVSGDAAATARNIASSNFLFRLGFASYLVEAVCDITLALVFYMLLKPVRRDLALLAAFFGLLSTALYAVAEFSYFAAGVFVGDADYLKAFSPDQRAALALLAMKLYAIGGGIFLALYGITSVLRGYLIIRSRYLPAFLGVLLVIAGTGFIVKNLALVLAPRYAYDLLLMPMGVAGVALMLWLLTRGVDMSKWESAAP